MLTFELFEHGSKSKLKSEILLYYKTKKTLHVLNLPNGWNSVYHNLCNGMESSKHSMVKSLYFFFFSFFFKSFIESKLAAIAELQWIFYKGLKLQVNLYKTIQII